MSVVKSRCACTDDAAQQQVPYITPADPYETSGADVHNARTLAMASVLMRMQVPNFGWQVYDAEFRIGGRHAPCVAHALSMPFIPL